jgi:hypothetical protein
MLWIALSCFALLAMTEGDAMTEKAWIAAPQAARNDGGGGEYFAASGLQ